jgi:hypothetical protein
MNGVYLHIIFTFNEVLLTIFIIILARKAFIFNQEVSLGVLEVFLWDFMKIMGESFI